MITNVRYCAENEIIEIIKNWGGMKCDIIGTMKWFPMDIHNNKSILAEIISLLEVKTLEDITVKMDTKKEETMCVYVNEEVYKLKPKN